MTPLMLAIVLHYNNGATDYRDGDFSAPAVAEAIGILERDGLLSINHETRYNLTDGRYVRGPKLAATDRLKAFVGMLVRTPLPVHESSWRDPRILKLAEERAQADRRSIHEMTCGNDF